MSILPTLWASGATAAAPALRLLLRQRLRRGREIARRLGEREGLETTSRPPGRLMWLHAASVGESVSIIPVLSELARQAPGMAMLVTTGTVSSAGLLVKRAAELGLQDRVAHRFVPLDVPLWVGRFLDHWHPDVAAFVESELWPNLIQGCGERRIPLALLNARISARSYRHWRRAPGFARKVLGEFSVIQAQSDADATRLRELGALRVTVPGNLKFAAPPLPMDAIELARTREWLAGRPCWVAASTHPGEEPIIIEAHRLLSAAHRGLVTILVPRHPDRGGQIARTIEGLPFTRRSLGQPPPSTGVWIADTLGELGLWYRIAGIALIGRSLIPPGGGQNPIEAGRLGCAVASGPYTGNFADAVQVLDDAGALARVTNAASIAAWVGAMLAAPEHRSKIGAQAAAAATRCAELPAQIAGDLLALMPARSD